jgi:DNA adenine methylase
MSAAILSASHLPVQRPVLRYHGGKFRLAPELLKIFPPHRVYTEVFGGGASVLLLKPRCYSEIYNDLDGEVVNVFRVLQNPRRAKRLEKLLRLTPFAREEFLLSYKHTRSEVERARRTLIRAYMGWGSDSISRMSASRAGFNTRISSTMSTGFRWNANKSGTTGASDWAGYPQHLASFCERLQGVTIEQRDAKEILRKMDRRDCLHYVDPPYPMSVRSFGKNDTGEKGGNGTCLEHRYRHEMTDRDHCNLASVLHSLKGMVVISSYDSPLYARLYKTWKKISWTSGQFCSQNTGDKTRTECVWLNRAAVDAQTQGSFW